MTITFEPIGIIHSPFSELKNMPIQPAGAAEIIGTLEILPQDAEGLADLEGFSHLYLLYHFHCATRTALSVVPFLDKVERGVDILDGTPLLDIKPYIASFDQVTKSTSGWMKAGRKEVAEKLSDGRFT